MARIKGVIPLFLFLFFISFTYSIEECKGTITTDETPCLILLPYTSSCSGVTVDVYNNGSTLLYTQTLSTYNSFKCNATFNQNSTGTYTFSFSNGDTGSIILEEDIKMYFFNLTVYGVMLGFIMVLILFMHIFNKKEHQMSPIIFGALATALSMISIAMLASGFSIVKDIVFIVDVNYYFMILFLGLAIWTGSAGVSLYRDIKPKEEYGEYYG